MAASNIARRFMKTLYYDCFAGISGDMNLGALVDAGADPAELERRLRTIGIEGWRLEFSRESRLGVCGTRARVVLDSEDGGEARLKGGDMDTAIPAPAAFLRRGTFAFRRAFPFARAQAVFGNKKAD